MVLHAPALPARRGLLIAAAAACLPAPALATAINTPHDLAQAFRRQVLLRLEPPPEEVGIYARISELNLLGVQRQLLAPQYLLVIDRNPHVQAALLFWRLVPGSWRLVGASPVSTGQEPDHGRASQSALFEITATRAGGRGQRVYQLDRLHPGLPAGRAPRPLQMRAADDGAETGLGSPCTQDCILVPASLADFLDEWGVLDAATGRPQRHVLPYRGRHLLLVDSERDDRPAWSPLPFASRGGAPVAS